MTASGEQRAPKYFLLLATVALASVLAPLNSTMLAVALPQIRSDFSVGHAEIGWLVSAYLIAMAVAQPVGGRLGDQLGHGRVFRAGLVAFLALSLAAAFAPNFPALILLRTGQALIGAAFIPNGMAMLRQSLPASRLGRSSGITGSAISISAAAGPLLGAGLLAAGSWRWLFLMNGPLVVLVLLFAALLRYPDKPARRVELDWLGGLVFAALLASVTLSLNSLGGDASRYTLAAGILGLVVFAALFFQRQFYTSTPIAEWRLFRNRSFSAATAFILLTNLVMYTTLLAVPFFVEEVQGKGSTRTGVLLGAMSGLMVVVSPLSGLLSDVHGRRLPIFAGGLVLVAAVLAVLAGLDPGVSFAYLGVSLAAFGLALGLSTGPAQTAAIEAAPREMAGTAAGTNSMMRYLGSIVGAGLLGSFLSSNGGAPGIDTFRLMFAVLAVMAALATLSSLFIHRFAAEARTPVPEPAEAGATAR